MTKLRILYLHNNLIDSVTPLEKIFTLKSLRYLTIFSNPVTTLIGIRHYIVN